MLLRPTMVSKVYVAHRTTVRIEFTGLGVLFTRSASTLACTQLRVSVFTLWDGATVLITRQLAIRKAGTVTLWCSPFAPL